MYILRTRINNEKIAEWAKNWVRMRNSRDYKIVYDEKESIAEKRFKENPVVLKKIGH